MTHEHGPHNGNQQQSKAKWVFAGFLIIAGYFLITEHRAHLSGWLSGYGIWLLLLACPLMHLFILFAFSFAKPQSSRDWRSFGAFSAFLVALFTEMYGFPLTIYLLSGWLSTRFPGIDWMSHDSGHLLETIFGWKSNPHFGPFHVISNILIVAGLWLLASAWKVLYAAQRNHRLATTEPYARVRHPQYAGFILIMIGFLFQWPTLVTLAMFPILVSCTYVLRSVKSGMHARDSGMLTPATKRTRPHSFPGLV